MCQQVFIEQVRAEEGRVVGVESYQQTKIEVATQRMLGKGGADPGSNIRGRVQFERYAAGLQLFEELGILDCREGVPDALRADSERLPNGLGAGGFTRVVGEPQAGVHGPSIERAERFRAGAPLIAAEANADNRRVDCPHFGSFAKDARSLLDREVAHRVEDPIERKSQLAFGPLPGTPPNLPCWRGFPLAAETQRVFGVPARVDNDANAAGLAEYLWGSGRGSSNP